MLTVQPVIGEKEILTMNSGSLGKARRRAVRKFGFLVVLMLVTLAYAATPAFACDGNNNGGNNNNNGGGNNKNNGGGVAAATDQKVLADLNAGVANVVKLIRNGQEVKLTDIKPPDIFTIEFKDATVKNVKCLAAGAAPVALVTLPQSKKLVEFLPLAPAGTNVKPVADPKSVANGSKETFSLFLNSSPSDWQLLKLNGSPLNRNAIKKVGQTFKIEKIDKSIVMRAVYLGSGFVLVTNPSTKQLVKLPLSNF
jgi:hypothetical protein